MDRRRILLVVAVVVAALAATLVFVYASRAKDDTTASVAMTTVLVATQDIAPGESANEAYANGKITTKTVPVTDLVPGAGSDGSQYTGLYATTTIYNGEQLLPSKFGTQTQATTTDANAFLSPLKGDSAIAINVDTLNHVGPFVQPGSRVAIMAIPPANSGAENKGNPLALARAKVLIPNVLVLGVCTTVCTTSAITPAQVQQALTQAQAQGTDATGGDTVVGNGLIPASNTEIVLSVNQDQNEVIGGATYGPNPLTLYFSLLNKNTKIKQDINMGPNLSSASSNQGS